MLGAMRSSAQLQIGAARQVLQARRAEFRAGLAADTAQLWSRSPGRIAAVLSGGGARGAYEAGVLLAFQDAALPTHILTSTSVGSINAGSYAAQSSTLVGNAEPAVDAWFKVTSTAVGIDWGRYLVMLAGLIAATAGFGNLARAWLYQKNVYVHLEHPRLAWLSLGLAGLVVMWFYDSFPYLLILLRRQLRHEHWKPRTEKILASIAGNAVVLAVVWSIFVAMHLHLGRSGIVRLPIDERLLLLGSLALLGALGWLLRRPISLLGHKFLRLPLRSGLFANFDRSNYLRDCIPAAGLRASPIRVVVTSSDIRNGEVQFFTNANAGELARDPGVDVDFVRNEVRTAEDLFRAVIASSAFPLVYELVQMEKHDWTDGGIVANQPIRPAIRLGAEVLFLIMVEPRHAPAQTGRMSFLDVGLRALEVLVAQNVKADLRFLENINGLCEASAAPMNLRPEQVTIELGARRYRYLKAFTVCPETPLAPTVLDFDGRITAPAILQGYADGCRAVLEFRQYLLDLPHDLPRVTLRLAAERAAGATVST